MGTEWLRLGSAGSPLASFIFLAVVTAFASAINSVAGGGTILTFPVLAAILPVGPSQLVIATVTSKIGLWPGALAAAGEYRHERRDHEVHRLADLSKRHPPNVKARDLH